jgi:hypothetical protein
MNKLGPDERSIRQALFHHIGSAGCPKNGRSDGFEFLGATRRSGAQNKRLAQPENTESAAWTARERACSAVLQLMTAFPINPRKLMIPAISIDRMTNARCFPRFPRRALTLAVKLRLFPAAFQIFRFSQRRARF